LLQGALNKAFNKESDDVSEPEEELEEDKSHIARIKVITSTSNYNCVFASEQINTQLQVIADMSNTIMHDFVWKCR